jgi:ATP-dependent DNA ligase
MLIPQPMPLVQQPEPFDDWDWIYEIKHDGFRALAVIEQGSAGSFPERNTGSPVIKTFERRW